MGYKSPLELFYLGNIKQTQRGLVGTFPTRSVIPKPLDRWIGMIIFGAPSGFATGSGPENYHQG